MKYFADVQHPKPEPAAPTQLPPQEQKQLAIKRNLVNGANIAPDLREPLLDWIRSFPGGISKAQFETQLCRLDKDIEVAKKQLADSIGYRQIKLPPRKQAPKLPGDIEDVLVQHSMIAIEGRSGRKAIDKFLETLSPNGVYILDVNELVLEYIDYNNRGKAAPIIEAANRADVLIIEGLEKSIALAYHIKDTLYQLAAVRKKNPDKLTITTWIYTHEWYIPEYGQLFEHYSV